MTTITCTSPQGQTTTASLEAVLTPALRDAARRDANAWIKRLRLAPYHGGRTMRQRFTYRNDSLWWFTELYLHKMRRLDAAVTTLAALDALRRERAPTRLVVETSQRAVAETALAFGRARHVAVELARAPGAEATPWLAGYRTGLTARLSRLRPGGQTTRRHARVAAFVHTAFWKGGPGNDGPGQESYIGPVLERVAGRLTPGDLACVGVGPRRNFRTRRWWDPLTRGSSHSPQIIPVEQLAPSRSLAGSMALWKQRRALADEITRGDGIRAAAMVEGCDLWEVLRPELEAAALLQWPWSVRAMDEAGAALDALEPDVVVTYAEAGAWGRALVLEARRRGVPSVGLQHGFIYRHWLNYQHEPDEIDADGDDHGFPAPDRTLVFDEVAATHLRTAARLPAGDIVVTGSPRLDDLAARFTRCQGEDRDRLRAGYGAGPHEQLLVLAAKFTEISAQLPPLFAAVQAAPSVRLIVKAHPAETPAVYAPLAGSASRITVLGAEADLAPLLAVADGLVTMNSTVAIDSLVLGVPVLVVGEVTNLDPFVAAGVMIGASDAGLAGAIDALLYDHKARRALIERARLFADAHRMQADGGAAERAAGEILGAARSPA